MDPMVAGATGEAASAARGDSPLSATEAEADNALYLDYYRAVNDFLPSSESSEGGGSHDSDASHHSFDDFHEGDEEGGGSGVASVAAAAVAAVAATDSVRTLEEEEVPRAGPAGADATVAAVDPHHHFAAKSPRTIMAAASTPDTVAPTSPTNGQRRRRRRRSRTGSQRDVLSPLARFSALSGSLYDDDSGSFIGSASDATTSSPSSSLDTQRSTFTSQTTQTTAAGGGGMSSMGSSSQARTLPYYASSASMGQAEPKWPPTAATAAAAATGNSPRRRRLLRPITSPTASPHASLPSDTLAVPRQRLKARMKQRAVGGAEERVGASATRRTPSQPAARVCRHCHDHHHDHTDERCQQRRRSPSLSSSSSSLSALSSSSHSDIRRGTQEAPPPFYQASLYYDSPYAMQATILSVATSDTICDTGRRQRAAATLSAPHHHHHHHHREGEKRGVTATRAGRRRCRRRTRTASADPPPTSTGRRATRPTPSPEDDAMGRRNRPMEADKATESRDPSPAAENINYHQLLQQVLREDEEKGRRRGSTTTSRRVAAEGDKTVAEAEAEAEDEDEEVSAELPNFPSPPSPHHQRPAPVAAPATLPGAVAGAAAAEDSPLKMRSKRENLQVHFREADQFHPQSSGSRAPGQHRRDGDDGSNSNSNSNSNVAAHCPYCAHPRSASRFPSSTATSPACGGGGHPLPSRHSHHSGGTTVPSGGRGTGRTAMRYVVGIRQLLFQPNALEYEEQDSRVWAMGFNELRRLPSVWDPWRGRRRLPRPAATDGDSSHAAHHAGPPSLPVPEQLSPLSRRRTSTTAAASLSAGEEDRAKRHAWRVGALKVGILLIDMLTPISIIIGAPLFLSAVAISGFVVLLPCALVMAVPVYWSVVKLHNACFSWNTWQGAAAQKEAGASPRSRKTRGGGGSDEPARSDAMSGGWLLTTPSVLDLADRFGGRRLCSVLVTFHTAVLLAGAVLMLSTGVVLTGGSANTLSFLRRHSDLRLETGTRTLHRGNGLVARKAAQLASGGCQLYPREHLLPLFLPFFFFLMFAGATTPLLWARRIAYWDTALFKLATTSFGLVFALVLVAMQLHWRLFVFAETATDSGAGSIGGYAYTGSGRASSSAAAFPSADRDDGRGNRTCSGLGYPYTITPSAIEAGLVPSLWWLHSPGDASHWFWRHFTTSFLSPDGGDGAAAAAAAEEKGGRGGRPRGRFASTFFALLDFTALHLSISAALLTWIFAFLVFAVKAGAFHFFLVPLLWRGRVAVAAAPTSSSTTEVVTVSVRDASPAAVGSDEGEGRGRLGGAMSRMKRLARSFMTERHALWQRRLGAYGVSGFGSSFTIAFSVFACTVVALTVGIFVATPVSSVNLASPLHLRLLWTAVTVDENGTVVTTRAGMRGGASLRGAHGQPGTEQRRVMCDLGIQAGLPIPLLYLNAALSMSLGIVCYAWIPYFIAHAASTIAIAWHRRISPHSHTPYQLQEESIRAFMRSKWAVAMRETPEEVEAYLEGRPRTRLHQPHRPHPPLPSRRHRPPLRSVAPDQLFRLNSAFMLSPEQHRATTRTGVPIRMDKLYQYLRLSTRDVYYFNDRFFFRRRDERAAESEEVEAEYPSTSTSASGGSGDAGDDATHSGGGGGGAMACRRIFTALLLPSTLTMRDGFAMRAWALVTEFALLRLPFLVLCFVLSALVVAGPTARCNRFWNFFALLRAWGHYDGSPNRLHGADSLGRSSLPDAARHVRSGSSGWGEGESDHCAEPILADIDEIISGRVLLAAASAGGVLTAPLVFGLPLLLLLKHSLSRRREESVFHRRLAALLCSDSAPLPQPRATREARTADRGEREDLIVGGLAGAQFFFHQQADTRTNCTVAIHRHHSSEGDGEHREGWPAMQRDAAVLARLWHRIKCPLRGALRRFERFFVHRAYSSAAFGVLYPTDAVACHCHHPRRPSSPANSHDSNDGGYPQLCGFCMARHRRWWGLQRMASRIAQTEPRVPPLSSAFYTRHLYEAFTQQRQRQHREGSEEGGEEEEVEGDDSGTQDREDAVDRADSVAVPLLGNASSRETERGGSGGGRFSLLCCFRRRWGADRPLNLPPPGGRDSLGSLMNAVIVVMFLTAWVLATLGAARALSLLW